MPVKRLLYTVPGEQVDDLLPTVPAVVLAPSLARAVPESVCVTGASGFVAQEMVAQLLEGGFDVHGTVFAPWQRPRSYSRCSTPRRSNPM